MKYKLWIYLGFFGVLFSAFLFFVLKDHDYSKSKLGIINPLVPGFTFIDQDGKAITQDITDDKVYVAEYFFTTCKGICPMMNANMRRVYNEYKNENNFLILSHTCMPEVDSMPVLKKYANKMITGKLIRNDGGSYKIKNGDDTSIIVKNTNWHFLTGDKEALYKMARQGYMIDNGKPDSLQKIQDQFIHTQFFALVDKNRRVRGIYDGLKENEVEKLIVDIKELLNEKVTSQRFMNGFSNNPN